MKCPVCKKTTPLDRRELMVILEGIQSSAGLYDRDDISELLRDGRLIYRDESSRQN